MVKRVRVRDVAALLLALTIPIAARAETPQEWITLGARVHGGFGSFIPVGIRIGRDALQRLNAKPREVTVVYYDSDKAPCACIANGVAIATQASVGQRTLQIAPEEAPNGTIATIIVRHKRTGQGIAYTVPDRWLSQLAEWNRTMDVQGRYDQVMKADGLFEATELK